MCCDCSHLSKIIYIDFNLRRQKNEYQIIALFIYFLIRKAYIICLTKPYLKVLGKVLWFIGQMDEWIEYFGFWISRLT